EQALDAFREAIRLDPQAALPRLNMANALFSLNRFGETKQVLRQAEGMHDQLIDVRRLQYLLAFVEGDHAAMSGYLADALKLPEAIATADWEARASAFAGRLHAAHDQFSRAIETVLQAGFTAIAGDWTIEDAESHAVAGQCREARTHLAAALALSRDSFTLARGSSIFALCRASDEANHLMEELAQRFPDATLVIRVALRVPRATLALQRGGGAGRDYAARAGPSVRPFAVRSVLARVHPRPGVPADEEWRGRSGAIPEHPRSSWW